MKKLIGLIVAMATLIIFAIFQRDNVCIWLGSVYILISYLSEEFKGNIIKNTIELIILEVVIGIGAYLANLNLINAAVITFIICFYIYYRYVYYTKRPQYLGFLITYVMLVFSPITIEKLPTRLFLLICVAIFINIIYFFMNKKDFIGNIDLSIHDELGKCEKLLDKILLDKENTYSTALQKDILKELENIEIRLYRALGNNRFYESDIKLRILITNFLGGLINIIKKSDICNNIQVIKDINNILKSLYKFNDNNLTDGFNIKLEEPIEKNEKKYVNYEIEQYVIWFNSAVRKNLENKNAYFKNKKEAIVILKKYSKKYNLTLENGFRSTSVKFNTAIRYSILMVIGVVSVKILNIPHGLWLLTTITVVGLPYKEETNRKGVYRVQGTFIGIVLFLIITFFTTTPLVMIAVTIISVYLSTTKKMPYNISSIFITLSALCPSVLIYTNENFVINSKYRISLVFLGCLGVIIFNNSIFPYSIKVSIKNTFESYKSLVFDTIELFEKDSSVDDIYRSANELLLINKYLWTRLVYNNNYVKSNYINKLLSEELVFTMSISSLLEEKQRFINNENFIKDMCICFRDSVDNKNLNEIFYKRFYEASAYEEKLLIINIYRIYIQVNIIDEIIV
ncbi:FUSC family protein [Clostridium botulinum]|nr:FUSC family protein [Clostridium botulinum]